MGPVFRFRISKSSFVYDYYLESISTPWPMAYIQLCSRIHRFKICSIGITQETDYRNSSKVKQQQKSEGMTPRPWR